MRDIYEILEVDKNASDEDIKKSYRRLSKLYHPDKNSGSADSEEKFKELNDAYSILSNPEKKSNYDKFGNVDGGSQGFNMNDIFSHFGDIFGEAFGGFGTTRQKRGSDMRIKTMVSLNETIFGVDREIKYRRNTKCKTCDGIGGTDTTTCRTCNGTGQRVIIQQTQFGRMQQIVGCNDCGGEGKKIINRCNACGGEGIKMQEETLDIKIPPGALTGMQLNLQGYGNYIRDGKPGDLYVLIEEIPDNKFKREGTDLNCEEWISIPDAVLGTKINIDTPHGRLSIDIPPGSDSGKIFTIRGKGIPGLSQNGMSHGMGNLKVKVNVKIPKNINKEQKMVFEKMKEII